jgi:hypothetical protein
MRTARSTDLLHEANDRSMKLETGTFRGVRSRSAYIHQPLSYCRGPWDATRFHGVREMPSWHAGNAGLNPTPGRALVQNSERFGAICEMEHIVLLNLKLSARITAMQNRSLVILVAFLPGYEGGGLYV